MKRVWITGFRSYELGVFGASDPKRKVIDYALEKLLKRAVANDEEDSEPGWLITGGQMGIEQWSLEAALRLEDEGIEIKTALMTPFAEFGKQWNEDNQTRLHNLMAQVNFSASVSQGGYSGRGQLVAYQKFMLEHTDEAIIFFDEEAEESKARYDYQVAKQFSGNHDYRVQLIDFDRLQEFAEKLNEAQRDY